MKTIVEHLHEGTAVYEGISKVKDLANIKPHDIVVLVQNEDSVDVWVVESFDNLKTLSGFYAEQGPWAMKPVFKVLTLKITGKLVNLEWMSQPWDDRIDV